MLQKIERNKARKIYRGEIKSDLGHPVAIVIGTSPDYVSGVIIEEAKSWQGTDTDTDADIADAR